MKTRIFHLVLFSFIASQLCAQWNRIDSITFGNINCLHFVNADTGYVHNGPGVIRRTLNGGQSWDSVSISFSGYINDMDFASANVGYAVGGAWFPFGVHYPYAILKTTNGGQSWDSIFSGGHGGVFDFVEVVTDDILYTTSTIGIMHSDDGGASFDTIFIPGLPIGAEAYGRIRFINPARGYVVGKAGFFVGNLMNLYETVDSGKTWNSIYVDSTSNFSNDFVMNASGQGMIVGNGSYVERTSDTGATWQKIALADTNVLLYKIEEVDGHLYAQGSDASDTTSGLYYSPDWGNNWYKKFSIKASTGGIVDFSIPTSSVGYFVTWRDVYKNGQLISLEEEARVSDGFEMYPNPAENEISIMTKSTNGGELRIYNALGQEVLFSHLNQSGFQSINISDLGAGIYFVELNIKNSKVLKKLVKH